jgi:hypothetical protein
VRLPLALEMPLLGGDAFGAPEERVATQVLVALLRKAKQGLIPDLDGGLRAIRLHRDGKLWK